jgi:hypothetical protein
MYVATTKDEGNAADGRFSTSVIDLTPHPALADQSSISAGLVVVESEDFDLSGLTAFAGDNTF